MARQGIGMRARLVNVAVLIALGMAATACGGGDGEQADTPAAASAPSSGGQSSETASGETDSGDEPAATPLPGDMVTGMSDACEAGYNFFVVTAGVLSGQTTQEVQSFFPAFVESVPDDLRDAAQVFGEAYVAMAVALGDYDGDVAAAAADPEVLALLEAIDSEEVTAAGDDLLAYFEAECAWAGS